MLGEKCMKITKVEIYQIAMPLKEPFIIAYTTYKTMPAIIVKVHTNKGVIGYGESVPDEHVTGESVYTVFTTLKHHLIPAVLGKDPRNIKEIHKVMNKTLVQNGAAKAAIDIACYDILGKVSQLPVYALLGGRKPAQPMIPKVLSILEPSVLAKQAKAAQNEGFKEIKMKLGTDPAEDIARVKAVREAVGDHMLIRADINQGWQNVQVAKATIKRLEPYHLSWVEQPITQESVSFFKRLKDSTTIPLMADESMITEQNLRTLIEDGSVDYVNIKLMKSGGIYPVYQLATQAELFGISCQIGSMVESSIGSAAGFHVALSRDNIVSTEISGPSMFKSEPGNLSYSLPHVQMTDQPGLGIEIDEDVLDELSVKREIVNPK